MYINNNFISKLETVNYYIGSFDANIELSKKLIMANSNISRKEADDILENMPTSYRASIMNKNNEYIGYIGIYDIDYKNSVASIRFEVNKKLFNAEKLEILLVIILYIINI